MLKQQVKKSSLRSHSSYLPYLAPNYSNVLESFFLVMCLSYLITSALWFFFGINIILLAMISASAALLTCIIVEYAY